MDKDRPVLLKVLVPLLLAVLFLSACVLFARTPVGRILIPATRTPTPTRTPRPTSTPTPTPTPTATGTATPTPTPTPTPAVILVAGDISICGNDGDQRTAALLAELPGLILTAGDNSNDRGKASEYQQCFGESWGQFKKRIRPAPGNHDYNTDNGQPYYQYFGKAAGTPGEGWYSFDYGGWHIVMLNSNCDQVRCGKTSPQVEWLRADLAAHPTQCSLAVWHHPRWSSGEAGNDGRMSPAYRALYEAGAEIVISGHDHEYERFTPLDPQGKPDPQRGIRQFVVGTGGAYYMPFREIRPESEAQIAREFGLLQLTLYPDRYDWRFIPEAGGKQTDAGSDRCH